MRKGVLLVLFLLASPSALWADASWAVLRQTAIQTGEHIRRLQEAVKTVQLLQSQMQDVQGILRLAQQAASGSEAVNFITDFRNLVLQTDDLIGRIEGFVDGNRDLSEEWMGLFGSLDKWVKRSGEVFENIKMSDSINSRGYWIADSYEKTYKQNSQYAQQFISHAKTVNEKGALKQIAEEMGHLIEMENQVIYLLSEILRAQSVEYSNANLQRKEEIVKFERENEGVQRFMSLTANEEFRL